MATLKVKFAEFLTIKSALQAAVSEAKHQAWRGDLHDNQEMHDHFEEHANKLSALIEKIEEQAWSF
jgi:hypothetical protein